MGLLPTARRRYRGALGKNLDRQSGGSSTCGYPKGDQAVMLVAVGSPPD